MRVPTTDGVEKPSPMSFTCQSNLGPSFGHCFRRPRSRDIPSRCGPRHWGQSEVDAALLAGLVTDTAEKHKQSAAMVVRDRDFMTSPSPIEIAFGYCWHSGIRPVL